MRQVVPVFTRFVQMPFARAVTPTAVKATRNMHLKHTHFDYDCNNGFGLCVRSMGPGTIAGKGKIISIGARLDAP